MALDYSDRTDFDSPSQGLVARLEGDLATATTIRSALDDPDPALTIVIA